MTCRSINQSLSDTHIEFLFCFLRVLSNGSLYRSRRSPFLSECHQWRRRRRTEKKKMPPPAISQGHRKDPSLLLSSRSHLPIKGNVIADSRHLYVYTAAPQIPAADYPRNHAAPLTPFVSVLLASVFHSRKQIALRFAGFLQGRVR